MNIRVSATIVVTAFFAITAQSADTDTCNHPSDCDHHEVPPKRGRTCRVYESQKGLTGVKVNAGTLDSPASNCQAVEFLYSVCPGYAGMSMSLWCDFEEEVAIYKDGVPLTGGTNVTYSSLQREHQGLYQCVQSVNGSNEVVGEFNMTVQSEIHIGGDEERCPPFFCHLFRGEKCCRQHWSPYTTSTSDRIKNPFRLIVYGDEPIEVTHEQEWVTNYTLHYPTDMEVFVTRDVNDSRALNVNYYYSPYIINGGSLEVDFRITASNNFSSFSTCITVHFSGSDINWNANTSLPRGTNAALGDNAVFTCEFGGHRNFNAAPHLTFELSLPDVDGENYTTLTTICRDWTECDKWSPANHSVGVSIQSVEISDQNDYYGVQYRYNIRLAAVMTHHNGSIFSCSLSRYQSIPPDYFNGKDVIQWKGSAQLFVHEADTATIPVSAAETSQKLVAPVSAVVVVIVLMSAVITVLLLAAVKFWKKKKSLRHGLLTDTIPLTAGQSCRSPSQSTLNSDDGPIVATIPSIAIVGVGGGRRDIIVGEMLHETRSMDSGVSCSEDDDNAKRPSSLQLSREQHLKLLESTSPVRLCRSETDMTVLPVEKLRTPRQRVTVYISYTDYASRWVRTTLKPMIDSWNIAEVMLPERDMVAGKAVSNERRRLIVEANKIILVISPDYYDSDWCSYELMHAIQSEPTLSRGRIIPILVDGCRRLPQNMEVVVPLFAHEQDFSQRLLAAVYPQPRLSQ